MANTDLLLALSAFLTLLVIALRRTFTHNLPLPPGPPPRPFLGNALDIPLSKQWFIFERWAREYGTPILVAT